MISYIYIYVYVYVYVYIYIKYIAWAALELYSQLRKAVCFPNVYLVIPVLHYY